jgi:hypothetical protein
MSNNGKRHLVRSDHHFAVLTKQLRVHVLNCSSSGCLIETRSRLDVGTIASLRISWEGEEFVEELRVVRCRQIEGAGSVYHVAVEFLWTAPPGSRSLRRAMLGAGPAAATDPPTSTFTM